MRKFRIYITDQELNTKIEDFNSMKEALEYALKYAEFLESIIIVEIYI